jgi:hypothetical protein
MAMMIAARMSDADSAGGNVLLRRAHMTGSLIGTDSVKLSDPYFGVDENISYLPPGSQKHN